MRAAAHIVAIVGPKQLPERSNLVFMRISILIESKT